MFRLFGFWIFSGPLIGPLSGPLGGPLVQMISFGGPFPQVPHSNVTIGCHSGSARRQRACSGSSTLATESLIRTINSFVVLFFFMTQPISPIFAPSMIITSWFRRGLVGSRSRTGTFRAIGWARLSVHSNATSCGRGVSVINHDLSVFAVRLIQRPSSYPALNRTATGLVSKIAWTRRSSNHFPGPSESRVRRCYDIYWTHIP